MRAVLIGYPGSQKIVKASEHLVRKYLPMFDPFYLNYKGDIQGWSAYLRGFLKYLQDDHIVFALDDYLISGPPDEARFAAAVDALGQTNVVCVKLCYSFEEEHAEYPVTTQYCIWDRQHLIRLLEVVQTPWEFEIECSRIHKTLPDRVVLHKPCIPYFTNSALSSRWEGVRLDGLKNEDINYLKQYGLL